MRRTLPVFPPESDTLLDNVGVATPCRAEWEAMRGDDRVRHCPACRMNVYNLSAMTREEATALIREREGGRKGRTCVRLYRRRDGTVITADCWERLRAARRRGVAAWVVAAVVIGVSQLALKLAGTWALWQWAAERLNPPIVETMGEIAAEPPPPEPPPSPEVAPPPPPPDPAPLLDDDRVIRMGKMKYVPPAPPRKPERATKKAGRAGAKANRGISDLKDPFKKLERMPYPDPIMGDLIVE